jgi:hypothetical protein
MTLGPFTVESGEKYGHADWWSVNSGAILIAAFREEADARAFVALPALQQAAQQAHDWMEQCSDWLGTNGIRALDELHDVLAALAQADGPKEQP